MRVIKKSTLVKFYSRKAYADSMDHLLAWHAEARKAEWRTPHDIKKKYPKASSIKSKRVVFYICHSKYRFVVEINYNVGIVYIRFIGTHEEYDTIEVETI